MSKYFHHFHVCHFSQDNYFEEALKMRNLLEELNCDHGLRPPTILGVREHVFTGRYLDVTYTQFLFYVYFRRA